MEQQKGVNSVMHALKSKMKAKIKNLTMINESHQIEIESYKQRIMNLENQLEIFHSSRLNLGLDEEKVDYSILLEPTVEGNQRNGRRRENHWV